MPHLSLFLATLAMAVLPLQVTAGEMSLKLPFTIHGLATCEAPLSQEVDVSCNWEKNDDSGYDILCSVSRIENSEEMNLTVNVNTWRLDKSAEPRTLNPGRRLSYDYADINCTVFVPANLPEIECTRNSDGLDCSWCSKNDCYEGEAVISQNAN